MGPWFRHFDCGPCRGEFEDGGRIFHSWPLKGPPTRPNREDRCLPGRAASALPSYDGRSQPMFALHLGLFLFFSLKYSSCGELASLFLFFLLPTFEVMMKSPLNAAARDLSPFFPLEPPRFPPVISPSFLWQVRKNIQVGTNHFPRNSSRLPPPTKSLPKPIRLFKSPTSTRSPPRRRAKRPLKVSGPFRLAS